MSIKKWTRTLVQQSSCAQYALFYARLSEVGMLYRRAAPSNRTWICVIDPRKYRTRIGKARLMEPQLGQRTQSRSRHSNDVIHVL